MQESNYSLLIAAAFSFLAALAHVGIIVGGASWYRFFGAGEGMAQMAEEGRWYPALITAVIALTLSVMGLYALSGAGVIMRLPLVQWVLVLVTLIFCVRGIAGLIIPFVSDNPYIAAQGLAFWLWSSGFCLVIGLAYLFGVKHGWDYLA